MKTSFLWIACLAAITGCNASQGNNAPIVDAETKTEIQSEKSDFCGTYEGILPAADCEGIKTVLTLNKDKTYILKSEYLGAKGAIFESKGFYHLVSDSMIELSPSSSDEKSYYKILDGNKIMLSNPEGTVDYGVLAEHYVLKKK